MSTYDEDTLALGALREARSSPTGWHRACCPFCVMIDGTEDRKFSFAVNAESGNYTCWRCGTSGRIRNMDGVVPEKPKSTEPAKAHYLGPPRGFSELYDANLNGPMCLAGARQYLAARGFGADACRTAGIGAVIDGWLEDRVVVPLLAPDSKEWLGWIARSWAGAVPKYLYPRGMARGSLLYNHAALLADSATPVIVVEGVFDALHCWPDAVAVLGKPTEWHVNAIAQSKRPVAVALDGDAWELGQSVTRFLQYKGCNAKLIKLPPCRDPNEMPLGDIHAMVEGAFACRG